MARDSLRVRARACPCEQSRARPNSAEVKPSRRALPELRTAGSLPLEHALAPALAAARITPFGAVSDRNNLVAAQDRLREVGLRQRRNSRGGPTGREPVCWCGMHSWARLNLPGKQHEEMR